MMLILKSILLALLSVGTVAPCILQSHENDIYGDFDGDGKKEYLWAETVFDESGYATRPFVLRCNDPKLDRKFEMNGTRRVKLVNQGNLDGGNVDYFSVTPYGDSAWAMTSVHVFRNDSVHYAIDGFITWAGGSDEEDFVLPGRKPGYARIMEYSMDIPGDFSYKIKEVKLK